MSREVTTVLVDFGSTFTKAIAVDPDGRPVGVAQHRTTVDSDVMAGLDAALAAISPDLGRDGPERLLACSSAGGGLRMGVVGLVADLTAEAARLTALGAGARVLELVHGGLADANAARELLAEHPDIVLLAGGSDGGNRESLLGSAQALAAAGARIPVVVAGNLEAQPEAEAILRAAGTPVFRTPNVMPAVDRVEPEPARRLIRELFIEHVIGGKLGDPEAELKRLVKMATPDAALQGVEVMARALGESDSSHAGGVIAVDIGGATTDVHSWAPPPQRSGYKRELFAQPAVARTVEGDLGMRWNAPGIVAAGLAEGLLDEAEAEALAPAAERRAEDPGLIPDEEAEGEVDRKLARTAIAVALRRHAGRRRLTLSPDGAVLQREGRDLSGVGLLVGAGGVARQMSPQELGGCLEAARRGREDRLLPERVAARIDAGGTLAAAGLLAIDDELSARNLVRGGLAARPSSVKEDPDVVYQR